MKNKTELYPKWPGHQTRPTEESSLRLTRFSHHGKNYLSTDIIVGGFWCEETTEEIPSPASAEERNLRLLKKVVLKHTGITI